MVEDINQVDLQTLRPCPRIARIAVEGASIRLVIQGDYPPDQLEILSASDVVDSTWTTQPATLTLREDLLIDAVLDHPGGGVSFYRVAVK